MTVNKTGDDTPDNGATNEPSPASMVTRTSQQQRRDSSRPQAAEALGRDGFTDPSLSCPARYELKDEHGRGGLGRVLCARDHQLGREVVVKELLRPGAHTEARFFREALITARLEHPSIVPVYSAGIRDDGSPFYAMKKIAGQPLKKLIALAPTLEARLRLLPNVIAVAEAIAYAHSERVIHRDLKPSNVIVGDYGETVVIDWGLAKDLASNDDEADPSGRDRATADADVTVAGSILGTPAYMAPEQARGEVVDARADVYALGALLYHLVAGAAPYAGADSGTAVLDQVISQPPRPLVESEPHVPADLTAIVAKAMSRDPADRYPSARELSADLRRFSAGNLVGAHRYSSWQLFARWVGRHRTAVIVAALLLAIMAVGGVAGVSRIASERDRARAQKALAEDNRTELEGLLSFMLTDLRVKLEPVGKLELLDMVATRASDYYADRPVDWSAPDEAGKRAIAHANVGDVLLARGDLDGALAQFRAGEAISARLVEAEPGNAQWQRDLADIRGAIGNALRAQGDVTGALAAYQSGLAIAQRLVDADPDSARWQVVASNHHTSIGGVLFMQGDHAGALREFRAANAIARKLVESDPHNLDWQLDLSRSHSKIGGVLKAQGDLPGALTEYRAYATIANHLVDEDPDNAQWQRNLSFAHAKVGDLLWAQNDLDGALVAYEAGRSIRQHLADRDPQNTEWQLNLSWGHSTVGDLLMARGDLAGALEAFEASAAIREQLVARNPQNTEWQNALGGIHASLGSARQRMGDTAGARENLARAADIYERSATVERDFYNAACINALLGNTDKAFEMLDGAVDKGWLDHTWAENDGDLASLHDDPRWKPLLERMIAKKP